MIKAVQSSKSSRGHKKHNQDTITEYLTSINKLEKIDRPNSLLFKARMQAYLVETIDTTQFGKAFDELLEQYPSFIDGYIHFWKYLKHRLVQLTGRSNHGRKSNRHASQVADLSGQKLLEKMHEISETALV